VTESVFSMDGDIADVKAIEKLAERYGANLVVDEAHATAVHGPSGAGVVAEARLTREVFATVHTCGKALASAGAFVCGARVLREFLINHARTLIFSTAMPPYMAGQIRAALRLACGMDAERKTLLENSFMLASGIRSLLPDVILLPDTSDSNDDLRLATAFQSTQREQDETVRAAPHRPATSLRRLGSDGLGRPSQIVPVAIGSNGDALAAAGFLQEQGFAVRAIRPPTVPAGTARLRLSLTARITREQVTGILAALQNWRRSQSSLAAAEVAGRA
jgi:8-amino-7-oxononanoate synthase